MRLKDGFITHESAGEHIMVPAGGVSFSGMVRSNQTAGYIVECLKEDTTPECQYAAASPPAERSVYDYKAGGTL